MCSSNTILCVDPDLFYNKLDSMKQSGTVILQFSNISELTKLHDLAIFFWGGGWGRCPEFPYKTIVAKLLFLFLYLYNNIICEIFSKWFFFVIMLVCLRIGAYVHTGQKIPASERQILYIPLAKITSDVFI